MRLGDVLELIAGACLVAAAYFATGLAWPALVAAGGFLLYLGQCYAKHTIALPKVSWLKKD